MGLAVALGVAGAAAGLWAKNVFDHTSAVAYYSSGMWGSSIAEAEAAGFAAGLKEAVVPTFAAVVLILAAVALAVAAAVRRDGPR